MKSRALLLLFFAACGGSAGSPDAAPDARIVPPTITITGTIKEGLGQTLSSGVTVSALRPDETTTLVAPVVTDASGVYTLTLSTGGVGVDLVGRYSKGSFASEWLYPGEPLDHDLTGIDGAMLSHSDLDTFGIFFATAYDSTAGLIVVLVVDANGNPASGATVTVSPPPDDGRYAGANSYPDASLNATSAKGIYYGWNQPITAGQMTATVTVSGSYQGAPLKSHTMKAHKGEIALTLLHP